MALNRTLENRWIRRYKTFFVFGFLILIIQLYIAVKFFTLHAKDINELSSNDKQKFDNIFDTLGTDEHSARHTKEETNLDDEDTAVNSNSVNIYKHEPDKLLDVKIIVKNKTVLRVEELNFVPLCDIGSKDAISAIHRAKTQNCKQLIANITCLIQDGQLYPVSLDNYCPHKDLHAGRSLGCYKDEKTFRLLSGYYANYKLNNSPEHCIRMCLQSGFVYAGVQYSTECFCGNDQPPSTARLPDPSCNMKCPANPRKACGGYFTINIYETGIAAFTPQQAELITPGKNQVRIAYLLTLNGRAVRQVKRLIKALFHIDHYFYIHIDARQDYMYRELLTLEKKYSNIKLARTRYATIWGGASLLQMLLNSMSDLLKKSDWKWDFVINLSESDFPVKSTDKLVEFLTANRGKNFVKSHGREVQRFIQKQGLDKTFIECDAHMWRTGDRQLPWGIQIDGGSDWIALSRDFIKYVTNTNPDNLINGLLKFFRYTLLPAESFFHTVLRNSQFCNTYIDNNLHVTNWKRKLGCKCQYKHVVDWCGCSPNDFKPDDWQRILATESKQLYFARKFEPVVNQAIILQLEDWLYGPHYLNVTNINSYWQSVYHSADLSPSPDDVIHTISNSILRLLSNQLSAHKCSIVSHELIEVTSYFSKDLFQGSILTYNFNSTLKMETLIKYQSNILISKNNNSLLKRLKSLYVSSEYDQKEQISRNFGRFLGPFSEPVIIYEFLPNINNNANKYNNITFVWVNPSGDVVDVGHAHIETNYVIHSVKLQLKGPLLPGIWTIKLVHDKIILAQSVFLVTPLEFIAKNPLTNTQSVMIHSGGGTITSVSKKVTKDWLKYGKSLNDRHVLKSSSLTNAKRVGVDLQEWIDTLVSKFYKIDSTCIYLIADKKVNNPFLCNNIVKFESCSNMLWSTFSPDPKSDISTINAMMQKLNLDPDSVR